MLKQVLRALLPPALPALILSCVFILPRHEALVESSISPDLPLDFDLPGWQGKKIQESEVERATLAADTRFSKAEYTQGRRVFWEKEKPPVEVSIVYSGSDMNASIHRPERCLPAQGHIDLRTGSDEITLADGRTVAFTRLTSRVPLPNRKDKLTLRFVSYYVFIGHGTIRHTHIGRTLQDMYDRVAGGYVQRWAYLQVSSYWAPELDVTEEETDRRVRALISELLPRQVKWEEM
ncbi:MAG: exosortase-associated EpsI family protein [Akkermansia sp.]|nr:exosortase-associated EpsI family protein [Akkermansia sp.]